MNLEVVTTGDLEKFRLLLLTDIKQLLAVKQTKKWLKSHEVMEMLDMSEVTLQSLRRAGKIPYKKLGGICYYNAEDIDRMMSEL